MDGVLRDVSRILRKRATSLQFWLPRKWAMSPDRTSSTTEVRTRAYSETRWGFRQETIHASVIVAE